MKDEHIHDVSHQTKKLIESLELYRNYTGEYPKDLSDLIPKYLINIPVIVNPFYFKKVSYLPKRLVEDNKYTAFEISISKKRILFPGDRVSKRLKYYSTQDYENTEYRVLHKVVDGWAAYTTYRNYNPNTIMPNSNKVRIDK